MTTSPTLYQHRIFCLTENTWVSLWKENDILLTTCPNNPAHVIQPGSSAIIDTVATGIVVINKENGIATGGHGRSDAVVLAAAAGGSAVVTKIWPFDIAIYTLVLVIDNSCVGTNMTLELAPLTTVGVLTADAPIGTTILSVSATVIDAAAKGFIITLQDGANTQEVGMITAINSGAGTITAQNATAFNFTSAGPTLVKITARAADNLPLQLPGYFTYGADKTRAIGISANAPLRFTFNNPTGGAAQLVVYINYNY